MSNGKCFLQEGEYFYEFDPYAITFTNGLNETTVEMGIDNLQVKRGDMMSNFNELGGCGQITPNIFTPIPPKTNVTAPAPSNAAPELYKENLDTLSEVLNSLDSIAGLGGVFDVEIRVRVDDVAAWAVIGYGESGDPCILRFER